MFKLGYQKENIVHNEIVRLNGTGFRKHLRANYLLCINMLYKITQPTRVDVEARDVNILIYSKCIACKKGAGGWEWNSWALSWQREILTSMSHHPHGIQIHMARSPPATTHRATYLYRRGLFHKHLLLMKVMLSKQWQY